MRCCCVVLAIFVALSGVLLAAVTPSVVELVRNPERDLSYRTQIFGGAHKALFTLSGAKMDSLIPFHRSLFDFVTFHVDAYPREPIDGVTSVDLEIPALDSPNGTVSIRVYTPPTARASQPTGEKKPVFVWAHGGGFISGSAKEKANGRVARTISLLSEFYLVSVEYRLAPEHPFPAAIEDFHSVLHWLNTAEHPLVKGGLINLGEILGDDEENVRKNSDIDASDGGESDRHGDLENDSYYAAEMDLERIIVTGEEAGGNIAMMGTFLWKERAAASKKDIPVDRRTSARPLVHHHLRGNSEKDRITIAGAALLYPLLFFAPLRLEPLWDNEFWFINRGMAEFSARAYLLGIDMDDDDQYREMITNNPFVTPFAECSQDVLGEWMVSSLVASAELEPFGIEGSRFYSLSHEKGVYSRIARYRGGTHRFLYFDDRKGQPVIMLYEFMRVTTRWLLGWE